MRILVCGINYYPELTGIAVYTTDMCQYLAQRGHDVEVVTGFPYYPQWRIGDAYRGKVYSTETIRSVSVRRCYLYVTQNITAVKRIVHESSFIMSSFFRCLFSRRPDLILVVSPPLGLGVSGWLLSKLKRAPLVFHVQDLQPDAALGLGMLKEGKLTRMLCAIEKFIYSGARLVTTISGSMRDRILAKGIHPGKVGVVPNWSTLEYERDRGGSAAFRREFGLEGKFVFLYSGNVGKKQGLETLIDAFAGLDAKEAVCLIVGEGVNIKTLKEKVHASGAENIVFLPLQPKERLLDMLRAADVCLVIQKKVVSDIVFPSKMTNIMAAGCAALITADSASELAQVVRESCSGYVALPENVKSLKEVLNEALRDPDLARKRENSRLYSLEHFDKEKTLSHLEALLFEVVG